MLKAVNVTTFCLEHYTLSYCSPQHFLAKIEKAASYNKQYSTTKSIRMDSKTNSYSTQLPSLTKWHEAVSKIQLMDILPIGFGGNNNDANIAAFFGDRRINLAVALALRNKQRQHRLVLMDNHTDDATKNNNNSDSDNVLSLEWLSSVHSEAISKIGRAHV